MTAVRTASRATRALFGVVLALVLALRLLSPAGFMPSFAAGSVTIVACPDSSVPWTPSVHHHGDTRAQHQQCPYAAAGASTAPVDLALLATVLFASVALLIRRPYGLLRRTRLRDRPPPIGPTLPA
jgi:hypothetical protein